MGPKIEILWRPITLKESYFFLMGCPLLRRLPAVWLIKFVTSTDNLFCPCSHCGYNSVCLWLLYPIQDKGTSLAFCLARSVEDPGDLLRHYRVWIWVTVSWTEPEVFLSVSGSPFSMNSSVAILYFPSLHILFCFGASVPYLFGEVANEKAESEFKSFFPFFYSSILLQNLICGLKLNSRDLAPCICWWAGRQGTQSSFVAPRRQRTWREGNNLWHLWMCARERTLSDYCSWFRYSYTVKAVGMYSSLLRR